MDNKTLLQREKPFTLILESLCAILIGMTIIPIVYFLAIQDLDILALAVLPLITLPLFLLIKWGFMKHTTKQGKNLKSILASIAIFMLAFPIASIISTYIWRQGIITWEYAFSFEVQEYEEIANNVYNMEKKYT